MWLRPVVEAYPQKAPSKFFAIDTYLEVDQRLNGNLFVPAPVDGKIPPAPRSVKIELATEEVHKLMRLYSALRYLYRNGFLGEPSAAFHFMVQSNF